MTGDSLQSLRETPSCSCRLGSLPMILLTSAACIAVVVLSLAASYVAAVAVALAVLCLAVVCWLRRDQASAQAPSSRLATDVSPVESLTPRQVFNLDDAIERCGGAEACLGELIDLSRTEFPRLLAVATEALEQGQYETLRRTAHTLKGSAMIFAAEPARHACEQVEIMARTENASGQDLGGAMDNMARHINELLVALEAHAAHAATSTDPP